MASKMTLEDVKKKKVDLELAVLELMKTFEKDTKLKVTYINTQRKRPKEKSKGMEMEYNPNKGPLTDVNVEVNFDLLF